AWSRAGRCPTVARGSARPASRSVAQGGGGRPRARPARRDDGPEPRDLGARRPARTAAHLPRRRGGGRRAPPGHLPRGDPAGGSSRPGPGTRKTMSDIIRTGDVVDELVTDEGSVVLVETPRGHNLVRLSLLGQLIRELAAEGISM